MPKRCRSDSLAPDKELTGQVFPAERVRELFGKPCVPLHEAKRHVFVTLDPAAGSDVRETRGSDFAVVSCVRPGIIVGMDAIDMTMCQIDHEARIVRHIANVIKMPELRAAIVVVILENNCAGNLLGGLLNRIRDAFPQRVVVMSSKQNKPGVVTTNAVKESMAYKLREVLNSHQLAFAENWVTEFRLNDKATDEQSRAALRDECREQLLQYARWVREDDNVHVKTRVTFSGKVYKGARDDLAVALQLWWFWMEHFFSNFEQYRNWH